VVDAVLLAHLHHHLGNGGEQESQRQEWLEAYEQGERAHQREGRLGQGAQVRQQVRGLVATGALDLADLIVELLAFEVVQVGDGPAHFHRPPIN